MNVVHSTLSQREREEVVRVLSDVRIQRDEHGAAVLNTGVLTSWVRFAPRAVRRLLPTLDPRGIHFAYRVDMSGDDTEQVVELEIYVARTGTREPQSWRVWVSREEWERAQHFTDMFIARLHDALN